MDLEFGTDPDQFEIHISDESPEHKTHVKPPESAVGSTDGPDLLRASLSDVVFTQALQLSENEIDLGDGEKNVAESLAHCADPHLPKPDLLVAASPPWTQVPPTSPSPNNTELSLEDIAADFEDAVDPPLLTSTLKAATEDSDDEFSFDLPVPKAEKDKGKSVRFTGECGAGEPAREVVNETINCQGNADQELGEEPQQEAKFCPPPVPQMSEKGDGKADIADTKIRNDDAPPRQDIRPEQNEKEHEDRSYLITSTAADWDNVQTVEAGFTDAQTGEGADLMTSVPPLLSFSDLWQHFRRMDHSAVKDKIQVTTDKKGFSAIISRLFGPPTLHKDLHADRELVFCIAATAFDNGEEHVQSLQTIYRVLTGSRFNCPRYGSHWEEIGFQGCDPATDLRGTGMLGLVQLVSFLQEDSTAQLARDLYKLSLHPTQNFPFCVMCINISRITLQALREGALNRECNSQKKVMQVVNQFYAGSLLYLYRVWQQGKTIRDSGFVIRDVETRAKKQSKQVFKDLQTYTAAHKAGTEGTAAFTGRDPKGSAKGPDNVQFFSVVKSEAKTAAELY